MFFSNWWGHIYVYKFNSNIKLKENCAYDCFSRSYCHFAFFLITGTSFFELMSLNNCGHQSNNYEVIRFSSSTNNLINTNFSNNKIQHSGMEFYNLKNTTFSYCTIINNSAAGCLLCFPSYYLITSINLNIINNLSFSAGIFHISGAIIQLLNSIFLGNGKCLFYRNSGSMMIKNSYFYNNQNIQYGSSISFENTILSFTQTLSLFHFKTQLCPGENLLQTPINTIIPSIEKTLEKSLNPTLGKSQDPTIMMTKLNTEIFTPINTLNPTLIPTLENTLNPSIIPTLENTLNPSIIPTLENTLNLSIINTPDNSVLEMTFNEKKNNSLFSESFLFNEILMTIPIFGIILLIFFSLKCKLEGNLDDENSKDLEFNSITKSIIVQDLLITENIIDGDDEWLKKGF